MAWKLKKEDWKVFQSRMLRKQWQILQIFDNFMSAWWLSDVYRTTAIQNSDDCLTTAWWLHDSMTTKSLIKTATRQKLFSYDVQPKNVAWNIIREWECHFKNYLTPLWLLVGCELKIVYQRRFQSACNIKHRWQTSVDHAKTMNHEKQEHSALQQALLGYAPGLHKAPLRSGTSDFNRLFIPSKTLKKTPCHVAKRTLGCLQ